MNLGVVYEALHVLDKAEETYKNATKLFPKCTAARPAGSIPLSPARARLAAGARGRTYTCAPCSSSSSTTSASSSPARSVAPPRVAQRRCALTALARVTGGPAHLQGGRAAGPHRRQGEARLRGRAARAHALSAAVVRMLRCAGSATATS
jgi:hypothetical protein